jgi:hypothetical protein
MNAQVIHHIANVGRSHSWEWNHHHRKESCPFVSNQLPVWTETAVAIGFSSGATKRAQLASRVAAVGEHLHASFYQGVSQIWFGPTGRVLSAPPALYASAPLFDSTGAALKV